MAETYRIGLDVGGTKVLGAIFDEERNIVFRLKKKSTEQGAEEVRRYFTANGLKCLVTDDPAFFTSEAMKKLKLVMLCNCNHELFADDAQREAEDSYDRNDFVLCSNYAQDHPHPDCQSLAQCLVE